jgi:DNA-binding NarL/FixJ family response regulator
MTDVFIATLNLHERAAFRLMVEDLEMNVVGEADSWHAALSSAATIKPDVILVDWDLVVASGGSLAQLRSACPPQTTLILVSSLSARQQATISSGADLFICRDDTPDRVAQSLRSITGQDNVSNNNNWPEDSGGR